MLLLLTRCQFVNNCYVISSFVKCLISSLVDHCVMLMTIFSYRSVKLPTRTDVVVKSYIVILQFLYVAKWKIWNVFTYTLRSYATKNQLKIIDVSKNNGKNNYIHHLPMHIFYTEMLTRKVSRVKKLHKSKFHFVKP